MRPIAYEPVKPRSRLLEEYLRVAPHDALGSAILEKCLKVDSRAVQLASLSSM